MLKYKLFFKFFIIFNLDLLCHIPSLFKTTEILKLFFCLLFSCTEPSLHLSPLPRHISERLEISTYRYLQSLFVGLLFCLQAALTGDQLSF
jgi:hypothetical protein